MTPTRLIDALACHRRRFAHARRAERAGEEAASFDLVVSTHAYSRRTKAAVEDKLALSATLVRAGEVDAASRLIEDLERDVRDHEAALVERVNELRCAQGARRERVTRFRVVRALASAVVSACMLSVSLLGVAFAAWVVEDGAPAAKHDRAQRHEGRADARDGDARARVERAERVKRVRIAGMTVELTAAELRTYRALIADGGADDGRLEAFLLSVLPADVAGTVTGALADGASGVLTGVDGRTRRVERRTRAGDDAARETPERERRAPAASDGDGGDEPDDDDDGGGDDDDDGSVDAGVDLLGDPGSLP